MDEIIENIRESLKKNRLFDLRETLKVLHPEDIAGLLERLEENEKEKVFSELDVEVAADVLLELGDESLSFLLSRFTEEEISEITQEMEPHEAADIVAELPMETREEVLELIPKETSKDVETLLQYPENTAGGIMSLNYVSFPKDLTIEESLNRFRAMGAETDLSYVYVTDPTNHLVGVLPLRRLLVSPLQNRLEEIMIQRPIVAHVDDDQEVVARIVKKYDLLALPVVDRVGLLKGVVRFRDVMDVLEKEATEDILRMGGTHIEESVFSSPLKSFLRRVPWLYVNLFTALIAASVVGLFTETIVAAATVAVFMPMVAGMGGNAGTQTLALIVRGIALGEVTLKDTWRVLLKQISVGFLTGIAIGILTALIAFLWKGNPVMGLVVGIALVINIVTACTFGALIPLTLKKLRLDPALGSGIFITATTDAVGFLVFLSLATLFIKFLK